MTETDGYDDHLDAETSGIGVGMGGSCPVCRAPIDLGQEFCLECGSPIRFTPRQRRQTRGSERPNIVAPPPPTPRGFPWVPFVIVLALVVGGVAFALVEGGGTASKRNSKDATDPALPEITNSTPKSTSKTQTTTLQNCDPSTPLDGTEPAVADTGEPISLDGSGGGFDSNDPLDSAGEEIPTISSGSDSSEAGDPFSQRDGIPSTEPGGTDSGETVTVDQNGDLCAETDDGSTPPPDDTTTTPTDNRTTSTTTKSTPTRATSASGEWPANEEGWTVVVSSDRTRTRANQRAADLQEQKIDAGVLVSSDFPSLCPGFYVVFSGRFDTKAEADRHVRELKAKNTDLFGIQAREIRRSGTQVECTVSRP